jgi:hypothetical protein
MLNVEIRKKDRNGKYLYLELMNSGNRKVARLDSFLLPSFPHSKLQKQQLEVGRGGGAGGG